MHIPDGYLSPSTCVLTYVAAAPFWHLGLKRVKQLLQTRLVPVLGVVSAFCFVIMMFNLPIPGGTTAHAVGMGVAAIVLGPWAGLLAISIALMIQALFFGDGGITAFGANCLNMAVVGSFAAYATFRLIAGGSAVTSRRRVVAAAIAGYVAINASALAAAIEFGVQPLLFHDATGAPLYAPYPLAIAVPAMMFAHLTVAGTAEAIATAGIFAYLQRTNASLLAATAAATAGVAGGWSGVRRLWIGLGGLVLASPLGLLAAGMAWGEWGTDDFADPVLRDHIAASSGNVAPPAHVPSGLARLSDIWTAPMPHYAPAFMHDENFGYMLSAVVGIGLILIVFSILASLSGPRTHAGARRAQERP